MLESAVKRKVGQKWRDAGGLIFNISEKFNSGIPDSYLAYNGCNIWVEFKIDSNKPTKLQYKVLNDLNNAGIRSVIVIYKNKTKGYTIQLKDDGVLCENIDIDSLIFSLRELCRIGG